jgi:hypothetical protein
MLSPCLTPLLFLPPPSDVSRDLHSIKALVKADTTHGQRTVKIHLGASN